MVCLMGMSWELFNGDTKCTPPTTGEKMMCGYILMLIIIAWTTGTIAVKSYANDRDEEAINNGAMRWVSDERGNLSRQWVKTTCH